jgi:hypothetical protein
MFSLPSFAKFVKFRRTRREKTAKDKNPPQIQAQFIRQCSRARPESKKATFGGGFLLIFSAGGS